MHKSNQIEIKKEIMDILNQNTLNYVNFIKENTKISIMKKWI